MVLDIELSDGGVTYSTPRQPSTNPSRVNSPIAGHLHSSMIPRQVTSSSGTLISLKNFMAPSMPMPLGLSLMLSREDISMRMY